jgi:hypothetical protein
MAEKKSILENALLDIKISKMHLTQTQNTRSVAREEIDGVVNESILKKMITKKKIYQLTNRNWRRTRNGC